MSLKAAYSPTCKTYTQCVPFINLTSFSAGQIRTAPPRIIHAAYELYRLCASAADVCSGPRRPAYHHRGGIRSLQYFTCTSDEDHKYSHPGWILKGGAWTFWWTDVGEAAEQDTSWRRRPCNRARFHAGRVFWHRQSMHYHALLPFASHSA